MASRTRHTSSLHLRRIHDPLVSFEVDKCLLLLDKQRALTHRCILERNTNWKRGHLLPPTTDDLNDNSHLNLCKSSR